MHNGEQVTGTSSEYKRGYTAWTNVTKTNIGIDLSITLENFSLIYEIIVINIYFVSKHVRNFYFYFPIVWSFSFSSISYLNRKNRMCFNF